jgi:hypothetical protein
MSQSMLDKGSSGTAQWRLLSRKEDRALIDTKDAAYVTSYLSELQLLLSIIRKPCSRRTRSISARCTILKGLEAHRIYDFTFESRMATHRLNTTSFRCVQYPSNASLPNQPLGFNA